jgi:uncharacterized membrane protein
VSRGAVYVLVGGAIVGALAWIDPIFLPLVLLGPIAHGAVEGIRGAPWRWVAGVWALGGIVMVVSDYVVNQEDVVFHLVLTVVMSALAAGAWFGAGFLESRRVAARSF